MVNNITLWISKSSAFISSSLIELQIVDFVLYNVAFHKNARVYVFCSINICTSFDVPSLNFIRIYVLYAVSIQLSTQHFKIFHFTSIFVKLPQFYPLVFLHPAVLTSIRLCVILYITLRHLPKHNCTKDKEKLLIICIPLERKTIMTDNELLLSISNIMDAKLQPLEKRMDSFDEKIDKVEKRVVAVEERVIAVEQQVIAMEQEIKATQQELTTTRQELSDKIQLINLKLENMIIPRLNEIESCYLSTSERYMRETDKFVAFNTDLSAMRSVIIEHGNRLSAIGA